MYLYQVRLRKNIKRKVKNRRISVFCVKKRNKIRILEKQTLTGSVLYRYNIINADLY